MEYDIDVVNTWAKKSCPAWNGNKVSRRLYRQKYRNAARDFWESPEHQRQIAQYKECKEWLNTYPWPYCDPHFADWEEDDDAKHYTLITDQSNCVVRYATSYVAWKIFEETGIWPQKTSNTRLDAKNWVQFLAEAGYTKVVERPKDCRHYVGIKPDEGEWGIVVWFEREAFFKEDYAVVSTYINKEHRVGSVFIYEFTWVEIE